LESGDNRRVLGRGKVRLDLNTIDSPIHHPDQDWFRDVSMSCVFDLADSKALSPEITGRMASSPRVAWAEMELFDQFLQVSSLIEVATFERVWVLLERHVGNSTLELELNFGLTGFYDEMERPIKSLREVLMNGEKYISPATVAVVTDGWSDSVAMSNRLTIRKVYATMRWAPERAILQVIDS
jgi:hypothetical protein